MISLKKILVFFFFALLPFMLSSCRDAREIDDWAYTFSIGIDKGVDNQLRVSIQIMSMKAGEDGGGQGAGGTAKGTGFTVITIDCPSFYTGVNMINTSLSKKINYMHARFFVISEELAREGIGYLMSASARDRQIRRTMHVIIVKGKAGAFIRELDPVLGSALSKVLEGMMSMEDETGFFDDSSFSKFIDAVKSSKVQAVATLAAINDFSGFREEGDAEGSYKSAGDYSAGELPRTSGNKPEFMGTALFNGGKMVGELNGDESRCLLMVKGDFQTGSFAVPDPSDPRIINTFMVRQKRKPEIDISFREDKAVIRLKLFLEGEIQALQSNINYENPQLKPLLENSFKEMLKEQLDITLETCQELNCDAFGFGEKACMQFSTIQEWESIGWLDRFGEAEISTEVAFNLRRTGTMLKTNPEYGGEE